MKIKKNLAFSNLDLVTILLAFYMLCCGYYAFAGSGVMSSCENIEGTSFPKKAAAAEEKARPFCKDYQEKHARPMLEKVNACIQLGEGKKSIFKIFSSNGNGFKSSVKSFNKDVKSACVTLRESLENVTTTCDRFKKKIEERGTAVSEASPGIDGKTTTSFKELAKEYQYGSRLFAMLEDRLSYIESNLRSEWKGSSFRSHNRTGQNSSLQGISDYYGNSKKSWLKNLNSDLKNSEKRIQDNHKWGQTAANHESQVEKCVGASKELETTLKSVKENLKDPYLELMKTLKSDSIVVDHKSILMKRNSDIAKIQEEKQGILAKGKAQSDSAISAAATQEAPKPEEKRALASSDTPAETKDTPNSKENAKPLSAEIGKEREGEVAQVEHSTPTLVEQLKNTPPIVEEGKSSGPGAAAELERDLEVELVKEDGEADPKIEDKKQKDKAVVADEDVIPKPWPEEKQPEETKTVSPPKKDIVRKDVKNYLNSFSPNSMGSERSKEITMSQAWYNLKRKHQGFSAAQRQSGRVNCSNCH